MKRIKNAKVTEIFWSGNAFYVRYTSKKKVHWKGFPNDPGMKIADTSSMYIQMDILTPHSVVLKKAYEILNNM